MSDSPFAFKDEMGNQHGVWYAIARAPNADGNVRWRCRCVLCGAQRIITGSRLRALPPSCPCEDREP